MALSKPSHDTPPSNDEETYSQGPTWLMVPIMILNWAHVGCLVMVPFVCMFWAVLHLLVTGVIPSLGTTVGSLLPFATGIFAHPTIALATIVLAAYLAGGLARRIGQPRVIGEIVVGIALGPSLLGWIGPASAEHAFLSESTRSLLFDLGRLGITLYLLLAGLQLDLNSLKGKSSTATLISVGALGIPLLLGSLLGGAIYPEFGAAVVSPVLFSMFLGTVMALSALPVLVRILDERQLLTTPLGTLAVACATVDDLLAWLIFGATTAGAGAAISDHATLGLVGMLVVSVMLAAAWPLWRRVSSGWSIQPEKLGGAALPLVLAWGLIVAGISESFGLHAGIGAFYAGVLSPFNQSIRQQLARWMEPVVTTLLVPAFFVYAGALTQFQTIDRPELWLVGLTLATVAVAAKGGTAFLLGRAGGLAPRNAAGLATLLNARGVMGLIILTAGFEAGLISPALFTLMILAVLITNVLVSPALAWFRPDFSLKG